MSFLIKIEPEAKEDIQSSIDWYNEQQQGLGEKFLKEIEKSFDSLLINPLFSVLTERFHFIIQR